MLQPPTAHLPPIKQLHSLLPNDEHLLHSYLDYIRSIYNPLVRGARRRGRRILFSVNSQNHVAQSDPETIQSTEQTELENLRSDAFEEAHALRWLSALTRVAQNNNAGLSLIDAAAALLASCSGASGAGIITRDFVFSSPHSPSNISVSLADRPLDNSDFRSVGAQTWGGACVLAEEIVQKSMVFFSTPNFGSLRILELGAGTGLVSLVAAKVCEALLLSADIVATDYYPSVLQNLASNVEVNFPSSDSPSNSRISTHPLDWEAFAVADPNSPPPILLSQPFDLILGADIVYEVLHAQWIRQCLHRLLRKPSLGSTPHFHLVIPLRPTFARESETVEVVFPFANGHGKDVGGREDDLELVTFSKEMILCDVAVSPTSTVGDFEDVDNDRLVKYAYYVIGWGYRKHEN